jgi:serine/threonine protein phosphatase 1
VRWVIGDIHGMLGPLRALVDAVRQADASARLYFAGDYVNRGPESRGVIDYLLTVQNARFLRGNHDDVFELILGGRGLDPTLAGNDRFFAVRWFVEFGLLETLESYGISTDRVVRVAQDNDRPGLDRLLLAIPASHRRFLAELEPVIDDPDLFVVHAKWPTNLSATAPGIAAALSARPGWARMLLWGRFTSDELFEPKSWGKRGYFGHTSVDVYQDEDPPVVLPMFTANMALVDTGVALSEFGRLTAVCVETHAVIQADRAGAIHAHQGPAPNAPR